MTDDTPPPGYRPVPIEGGFFDAFGPLFIRTGPDGASMAFRVRAQHLNPAGSCHGGAIATFADMQAFAAQWLAGIHDRFTPTITLTVDYMAPTPVGTWLEMRVSHWRATRRLLFSDAPITTLAGDMVARTNAVFSIARDPAPDPAFFAALYPRHD